MAILRKKFLRLSDNVKENKCRMLNIKLVPAEYGDCLWISVCEDKTCNILIDGGTKKTYQNFIKTEIQHFKEVGQSLNLMICTHMDYDHIGGLIEILKNEDEKFIKNIWYNGLLQTVNSKYYSLPENEYSTRDNKILDEIISKGVISNEEKEIGINEGMSLGVLIEDKKIPLNKVVGGKALSTEHISDVIKLERGIFIRILGPSKENLERVENVWKKEMIHRNYCFRISNKIKLTEAFEYQLETIKLFYANEKILVNQVEELEKYMGNLDVVDNSETNGSSISFILEYKDKKYLFLGDSIIDESILNNIKKAVGYNYRFAAIKLPHHGSRYNISLDFIKRYSADEYYCLTNSERFGHPDLEVLATIICNDSRHKKLIFNYPISKAQFLNKNEWKEKYNYEIIMGNGNHIIERIFE